MEEEEHERRGRTFKKTRQMSLKGLAAPNRDRELTMWMKR